MSLKIKALKLMYKKCPDCGGELEVVENYKVLLNKTFTFLRCKKCNWSKG